MKKEDLLKLGLDDATAAKVAEASAEELKGFIPKARFDEVTEQKNKLTTDLKTRDEQLEALKKLNPEKLQEEITKLQGENKAAKDKYEADLKQLQMDNAVEKALIGAKAKNIKAVKALLDMTKAELDGETVKGLDDQLKKLQESDDSKFLFDVQTNKNPQFKGFKPGEKKDGNPGDGKPATLADAIAMHFESKE
jgi:vancomycin resistance protein YoaR